jgi:hypothetical protein
MAPRLKLMTHVLVLVFAMILLGMFVSNGPKATSHGPYRSVLSSLGVATAEAAKHKCTHRICEPASPGYICGDAWGSNCVLSGGCTTVVCPGF